MSSGRTPFFWLLLVCALGACRGERSEKPPVHLVPDMDRQAKYQPQEASTLFEDGRAARPLVEGTVARGTLREDDAYERGRSGETFIARAPIAVDRATLARGQERFDIYCAPCHDRTGSGQGMVVQRGYPPPVDLSSDRVRAFPDGQIFDVITHGVRNMPAYGKQVAVADRWAIVAWLRVLQQSQHGSLDDVPLAAREKIESEGTAK